MRVQRSPSGPNGSLQSCFGLLLSQSKKCVLIYRHSVLFPRLVFRSRRLHLTKKQMKPNAKALLRKNGGKTVGHALAAVKSKGQTNANGWTEKAAVVGQRNDECDVQLHRKQSHV